MATIYDIAGTTSHTFTLGDGTTIFYGVANPSDSLGKVGDIYVRMTMKESKVIEIDSGELKTYESNGSIVKVIDFYYEWDGTKWNLLTFIDDVENDNDRTNYPTAYQQEHGTPLPAGTIITQNDNDKKYLWSNNDWSEVTVTTISGEFPSTPTLWDVVKETKNSYQQWNGTDWVQLGPDYNTNKKLGRIYYKEAFNNDSRWNFIKSYSFDDDVIHAIETYTNSNDFKIAIESADNDIVQPIDPDDSNTDIDYEVNHGAYGVTRYAVDSEAIVSSENKEELYTNYQSYKADSDEHLPQIFDSMTNEFIALTPAQVADNVKTEMKRAIMVEGKLSELNNAYFGNADKADLVTALNHEASSRDTKDLDLQSQIDAITSKSDVVDVVQYYDKDDPSITPPPAASASDIVHYDTSKLGNDDVVKVLTDENENYSVSYYRFNRVPETYNVMVASKAALNAYDTSLLHADDIAIVENDESAPSPYTNKKTYYKLSVNGTTKTWVYQGAETESWTYVGSVDAYYTRAQSDSMFMHKAAGSYETETVIGTKTFTSTIIRSGALSTSDLIVTQVNDTNNKGSIETDALYSSSKVYNRMKVTNTTASNKTGYLDLQVSDTGVGTLSLGGSVSSWANNNSSISKDSTNVALVGWVNKSGVDGNNNPYNNIVHLDGTETISGAKTFTGSITATNAVVTVATQNRGDSSTKAASTAFVADGLSLKQDTINYQTTDANKCFAVNSAGNGLEWRTVHDITTLSGLDDTTITSANNGEVLVYNGSKWVNGHQTTATIRYW